MPTEELKYMGSDPGAVKYGNFINYYSFHSTTQRTKNLHRKMFPSLNIDKPIVCLDIGCNTGELTRELYTFLQNIYPKCNIYMLAIDIDPTLIQRAEESNVNANISYKAANIVNESDQKMIKEYLIGYDRTKFDITFCFSVTMWIHINNGDDAFECFLTNLKIMSKTIIIEPQPWNCYRNAQRRVKKSGGTFPLYESLKIRNNVDTFIEKILLLNNTHQKIYESPNSNWNRKIQSYNVRIR